MHWVLHVPGQSPVAIDRPLMRIGSDPSSDIYLAQPGLAASHAVLHSENQVLWLQPLARPVHVNGRHIASAAIIRPGDDLHFGSLPARLQSAEAPVPTANAAGPLLNFSGRVVLRALTGREAGKAFALMNSLCIGRSVLSEIRLDDLALAERQVLVQRQGNGILAKNLSPVVEMRVDGWSCTEAMLSPGSQLCIDQHRFLLEAPSIDLQMADEVPPAAVSVDPPEPEPPPAAPAFFSKAQWLLLACAITLSGLIIVLFTLAP